MHNDRMCAGSPGKVPAALVGLTVLLAEWRMGTGRGGRQPCRHGLHLCHPSDLEIRERSAAPPNWSPFGTWSMVLTLIPPSPWRLGQRQSTLSVSVCLFG